VFGASPGLRAAYRNRYLGEEVGKFRAFSRYNIRSNLAMTARRPANYGGATTAKRGPTAARKAQRKKELQGNVAGVGVRGLRWTSLLFPPKFLGNVLRCDVC